MKPEEEKKVKCFINQIGNTTFSAKALNGFHWVENMIFRKKNTKQNIFCFFLLLQVLSEILRKSIFIIP